MGQWKASLSWTPYLCLSSCCGSIYQSRCQNFRIRLGMKGPSTDRWPLLVLHTRVFRFRHKLLTYRSNIRDSRGHFCKISIDYMKRNMTEFQHFMGFEVRNYYACQKSSAGWKRSWIYRTPSNLPVYYRKDSQKEMKTRIQIFHLIDCRPIHFLELFLPPLWFHCYPWWQSCKSCTDHLLDHSRSIVSYWRMNF